MAFRFQKLGYEFDRNDVDFLYGRFLEVADKKKEIGDNDLSSLAKEYQEKELLTT